MPGIEIKGRSKIANYRHGGRTGKFGGGRTNLLEQLGRVEAEPSNPNRRAEISRVHGELNRGYAKGGRAGHAAGSFIKKVIQGGKKIIDKIKTGKSNKFDTWETIGIPGSPGPKKGKYPAIDTIMERIENQKKTGKAEGGRIGKSIGGGLRKIAKTAAERWKKKKVYPETEDLTHQVGPYVGDVGSEGKRRKLGPIAKGKSPRRPQAPGPKGRRPWRGAIPGRPRPGTPAPNWIKPKKYEPAATGRRIARTFKKK